MDEPFAYGRVMNTSTAASTSAMAALRLTTNAHRLDTARRWIR